MRHKSISRLTIAVLASCGILLMAQFTQGQNQNTLPNNLSSSEMESIKRELASLKEKVEHRPKDAWDKLSSISTLLSGIFVTLIGLYATQKYTQGQQEKERLLKEREIVVGQVQTVEKFFPYLLSDNEDQKRAALEAIAATGHQPLALKLSHIISGRGSLEILNRIASLDGSSSSDFKEEPELNDSLSTIKQSVVKITSMVGGLGTGFFCTSWGLILTLDYIVEDLPKGFLEVTTSNGLKVGASVWIVDKKSGLALLSAWNKDPVIPLPIKAAAITPGEEVVTIGQTPEHDFKSATGMVSTYQVLAPEKICVDMICYSGFSGAPVLTRKGEFLGIISEFNPETVQGILIPSATVIEAFVKERTDHSLLDARRKEDYMGTNRYRIG